MVNSKDKGGSYEREIAVLLSKWWTGGERDDVFWRSHGSGGRSTRRYSLGKDTAGQQGDVSATDPDGQKLMEACAFEIKCGYGRWSFVDVLDRPRGTTPLEVEEFMNEAISNLNEDFSRWPVLIVKRHCRSAIIGIVRDMYRGLVKYYGQQTWMYNHIIFGRLVEGVYDEWLFFRLEDFLGGVDRSFFDSPSEDDDEEGEVNDLDPETVEFERIADVDEEIIPRFDGPNAFLSNFFQHTVRVDGTTYKTAEHAFQALKQRLGNAYDRVMSADTPGEARRRGKLGIPKEGWYEIDGKPGMRVPTMLKVLRAKFQHPRLAEMLLQTGDMELIEGNTWNDRFWGVDAKREKTC